MAMELLLNLRVNPLEKAKVIKLENINLNDKVEKLRGQIACQSNLTNDSFDLIYCGSLLESNCSLESYGLKNGSMVHVLKKKDVKEKSSNSKSTNADTNVELLVSVFKSFIGNPLLELAMRQLTKRSEVIENIISSSSDLSEDAVAIAILQDPDLIIHFTNADTLKKIAQFHPALLEAAQHIASAVHDEAHNFAASSSSMNSSSLSNVQTAGHSYSLENLSDDEEMAGDSSQSSDSTQPSGSLNQSRNQSDSTINAAQLFAAISRARRSTVTSANNPSSTSSPPTSSSSRTNPANGDIITFEMFNQAMQQAFASTPASNESANPPLSSPISSSTTNPLSATTDDMQRQIAIMHEMGLQDDAINIQALHVANGDVQAAIELVLSGFGDN